MLVRLSQLPLFVTLMVVSACAMMAPAIFAAVLRDWDSARIFLYSGIFLLVLAGMTGLAIANRTALRPAHAPLIDVVAGFLFLPLILAVPVWEGVAGLSYFDAYFEMVSAFTTTGASVLEVGPNTPEAIHLWRAIVGWLGGFFVWVVAICVFAPLGLGGFEVLGKRHAASAESISQISKTADAGTRLAYYAGLLAPVYAGLTLVLWVGLYLLGDTAFVALCHAMATLATSGISPVATQTGHVSGIGGEMLIAGFLIFALSRRSFTRDTAEPNLSYVTQDPEMRLGIFLVISVPLLLFFRHWVGAIDTNAVADVRQAAQALWGGVFMVISFLTTTGFESFYWETSKSWSGLETPGLIFLSLALIGGGVATTAGGAKLLRVFVLYLHGQRELDRLVHPSSVGRSGREERRFRRDGAFVAWIFVMLFTVSISTVMLALSLTGLSFEEAFVFAVAALSTTGPLVNVVGEAELSYLALTEAAKFILAMSMILGRLETLAIISLLNPDLWRR